MLVTIDESWNRGAIMLDRLYRFDPNIAPADGALALVVTPDGGLIVAQVWHADLLRRTAVMPLDGPGREGAPQRQQVTLVGVITERVTTDKLCNIGFSAADALLTSKASNEGVILRQRILDAILKAANEGQRAAVVPGGSHVTQKEFESLDADLKAAGYMLFRDNSYLRVLWHEGQ